MVRQILYQQQFDVSELPKLKQAAQLIVDQLQKKTVVLINGDLGAGKTQLVKFMVATLGGDFSSSPSFSLENIYRTPKFIIHHFDLYRLETEDEVESSGFWDAFSEDDSVILIEWADRLERQQLSKKWRIFEIELKHVKEHRSLDAKLYAAEE